LERGEPMIKTDIAVTIENEEGITAVLKTVSALGTDKVSIVVDPGVYSISDLEEALKAIKSFNYKAEPGYTTPQGTLSGVITDESTNTGMGQGTTISYGSASMPHAQYKALFGKEQLCDFNDYTGSP
jgi:hypothetical protein